MPTEFEFIRDLKEKFGLKKVGDDCAVLGKSSDRDLLVTTDMLVEDVDFRLEWTTPKLLGHKALAVSLSDIAAMGGTPAWALLSIAVPDRIWNGKFLDRFYEGWFDLASVHNVELVGGDVSRTDSKLTIDSVVAGEVPKGAAILRSRARPGDSIFVSGSLGGAAVGLSLLESGHRFSKLRGSRRALVERQLRPCPRVELGQRLRARGVASSMIDISDGLAADLHHICEASGVGALIQLDRIPVDKNLRSIVEKSTADDRALGGGEDFELLFTSSRKKMPSSGSLQITRIGEITERAGVVELAVGDRLLPLAAKGYRHF